MNLRYLNPVTRKKLTKLVDKMSQMTAEEIVSELAMTINVHAYLAIMLVEGETDQALYGALFNEANSQAILICPAGERALVTSAIDILNKEDASFAKLPPTIAAIDQDYLIPLRQNTNHKNILLTDLRDIECMMLDSEALKGLCDEYVDWNKAKKSGLNSTSDIRAAITRVCTPLGKVRYWSQVTNKHFRFKRLDVSECLDQSGNDLDFDSVLNKLRGAQDIGNPIPMDAFSLAEQFAAKEPHFTTDLLICRGHDLATVFAAQLRKKWGKSHARNIDGVTVERNLRLAFPRFWNSYQHIKNLKAWFSSVNLGHVVT